MRGEVYMVYVMLNLGTENSRGLCSQQKVV